LRTPAAIVIEVELRSWSVMRKKLFGIACTFRSFERPYACGHSRDDRLLLGVLHGRGPSFRPANK
jgi:hypothetical protein